MSSYQYGGSLFRCEMSKRRLTRPNRDRVDGTRVGGFRLRAIPDPAVATYRWEVTCDNVILVCLRARTIDEAEERAALDLGVPKRRVCAARVIARSA
jgi:hypothetical protein